MIEKMRKWIDEDFSLDKKTSRKNIKGSSEEKGKSSKLKKSILGSILVLAVLLTPKHKNEENVYLVDLEDEYQYSAVLYDENEKEIIIDTKDRDNLLALVDTKKTSKNEKYPVILVDDTGFVAEGYMEGKYLENKAIDKVKIGEIDGIDDFDIYNVVPKNGAYFRQNKIVDRNTDDAELLPFGEEVISTGITEVSNDNDYDWMNVIKYDKDNKTISTGYMASDFILNDNYELAKGKKFIVSTDGIKLKLRENCSTDSDVIAELKDGTEVILVPKISSVSDGIYDWFYIACKVDGQWKCGYSAATYYKDNGEIINYLQESTGDVQVKENRIIMKEVDTSSVKNVDLKLREVPGLDSEIVSKISNGTYLYVTQDSIASPLKKDGFSWVEVQTLNGIEGYVALEYLKDKDDTKTSSFDNDVLTIDFVDGEREGFLGIDVNNTIDQGKFSELLENDYQYSFNISGYKINNNGVITTTQTPDFAYLKLGATGVSTANFSFPLNNEGQIGNVAICAKHCEENNIPYGFYYYSQATTNSEIEQEVEEIKKLVYEVGIGEYNVLPLALDFEDSYYSVNSGGNIDTRIKVSADVNGKDYQTAIINKLMNRVRDELGIDVILYTDNNTLNSTFNFENLDDINQRDCWVVEVSQTHTRNLSVLDESFDEDDKLSNNRKNSQILTDTEVNNINIDLNFMDDDFYVKCLKKVR